MPDKLQESELFKRAMGLPSADEEEKIKQEQESQAQEVELARQEQEAQAKLEADKKLEEEAKAETEKKKLETEKGQEAGKTADEEVKVQSYDEWFAENEAKLKQYLVEKDRDYKSMAPEDLLRIKYQEENPDLTKEEIAGLLADDYSLGDKKIEIDRDTMDDDEIKAAEAHNKQIEKSLRKLNADAKKAAKEFETRKESIEKPVYKVPEAKVDPTERLTVEEFQERLAAEDAEIEAKQKADAEVWTGMVEQNVKVSDKFSYNGLEVDLTAEEQQAIKNGLLGYQYRLGDEKVYANEKGEVIWDKMVTDVAKSILLDKLLDAAKGVSKKEVLKKVTNYVNPIKQEAQHEGLELKSEKETVEDIFYKMKGQ